MNGLIKSGLSLIASLTEPQAPPTSPLVFFGHPNFFKEPLKVEFEVLSEKLEAAERKFRSSNALSFAQLIDGNGPTTSQSTDHRADFFDAFNNFYSLMDKMITRQEVLEIGSGKVRDGKSYLSQFFSHSTFTFSDVEAIARKNNASNYVVVDLVTGASTTAKTYNYVIASNVFDCFSHEHLPQAFKTISDRLKPGGHFIHITTSGFSQARFYEACLKKYPHSVFFPSQEVCNGKDKTLYRIDKDRVLQILETKQYQISPLTYKFLKEWAERKPEHQIAATLIPIDSQFDFNLFEDYLKTVFTTELQLLKPQELFENTLINAAQDAGFIVKQCDHFVGKSPLYGTNYNLKLRNGVVYTEYTSEKSDPLKIKEFGPTNKEVSITTMTSAQNTSFPHSKSAELHMIFMEKR